MTEVKPLTDSDKRIIEALISGDQVDWDYLLEIVKPADSKGADIEECIKKITTQFGNKIPPGLKLAIQRMRSEEKGIKRE